MIKTNTARTIKIPKPIPTLKIPAIALHELTTMIRRIKIIPLRRLDFLILNGLIFCRTFTKEGVLRIRELHNFENKLHNSHFI